MEKEIWKDINGYEGLYQVSNFGRVKSLNYRRTGREEILTPQMNTNGYLTVQLWKNEKRKSCLVHRLVAMAFIPNPNNLPEVNHKDEDKTNNCVWNLEWCDCKYNINYGTRTEKTTKTVLQLNKDTGEVIKEWPSANEVQRQLGYKQGAISMCCLGKCNQAYGFKWQYAV